MSADRQILVVDDDEALAEMCVEMFAEEGYDALAAHSGEQAIEALQAHPDCRVMLTDLVMPGMDGIELLRQAKRMRPELDVIVMTSYGTVRNAVEAMKLGANDYLSKPLQPDVVLVTVKRLFQMQDLGKEVLRLRQELDEHRRFESIIGQSRQMQQVYALISSVADTDANVLIEGPTGTGKELVAKAIHYSSPRKDQPFVKVDCAALSESLLESELFGHVHGSFTGATRDRPGRFRTAHMGTIFLDEVSNIPLSVQAKLLRVLQDSEFEPVGGDATVRVDVRVLAATNVPIEDRVEAGQFRRDLFYRLNVVRIELPPLRDRLDDIPALVAHFMRKYKDKNRRQVDDVSGQALDKLMGYQWPGNVRELENLIERALILCQGKTIGPDDIALPADRYSAPPDANVTSLKEALQAAERHVILDALRKCDGDKTLAAKRLQISRASIYSKIKAYRISLDHANISSEGDAK